MAALTVTTASFSSHSYKLTESVGEIVEEVVGRTGGNQGVCVLALLQCWARLQERNMQV